MTLVLYAFTSCDEEVALNTITLEITNSVEYLFEDGTTSVELEIPSGCTTWGDLLESGESFVIKVKDINSSSDTVEMILTQGEEGSDTFLFSAELCSTTIDKKLDDNLPPVG